MLTLEGAKARQHRLLELLQAKRLDHALIQNPRLVYYYTGALVDHTYPQAFLIDASGRSTLITNAKPKQAAVDDLRVYVGYTIERSFGRLTMQSELSQQVRDLLLPEPRQLGVDAEFTTAATLTGYDGSLVDLSPSLAQLRRRKDEDELVCMRETIRITEAGYSAAKAAMAPGLTEYDVYNVIHKAMVEAAETSLDLSGDFASGTRAKEGGAPTARRTAAGDLFILDLFPLYQGYKCDLCRTFSVSDPSRLQQGMWEHVAEAHVIFAPMLLPGKSTRAIYEQLKVFLGESFFHHAGHGVGMEGWEYPWLNQGSEDTLVEGEVIAFEPGIYSEALQGGIRLEHNYLITKDGPLALDQFPFDLN